MKRDNSLHQVMKSFSKNEDARPAMKIVLQNHRLSSVFVLKLCSSSMHPLSVCLFVSSNQAYIYPSVVRKLCRWSYSCHNHDLANLYSVGLTRRDPPCGGGKWGWHSSTKSAVGGETRILMRGDQAKHVKLVHPRQPITNSLQHPRQLTR